jgi:hypothetical protein
MSNLLFWKQLQYDLFLMYNPNRLEWHLGDELSTNPAGFCVVLSYSMTSLLTQFNRLVVAFAKSRDHRASCGVFAFGVDRQGALANSLHGLYPRNTDTATHPADCRPALIERLVKNWVQRWKQGPIYKRINPSSALGRFLFF